MYKIETALMDSTAALALEERPPCLVLSFSSTIADGSSGSRPRSPARDSILLRRRPSLAYDELGSVCCWMFPLYSVSLCLVDTPLALLVQLATRSLYLVTDIINLAPALVWLLGERELRKPHIMCAWIDESAQVGSSVGLYGYPSCT